MFLDVKFMFDVISKISFPILQLPRNAALQNELVAGINYF